MTNLHVLTDHQITMLMKAAGYTDEQIAEMDRATMEEALENNREVNGVELGFSPAPEGQEVAYALLRHAGYTDDDIAAMDEEELEEAVEEAGRDVLDEALLRAGYSEEEIEAMSPEEKMENVDLNDVMMFEALREAGYSDEAIANMSDEEKADALDKQTLMENEALREAGFSPEEMTPTDREEAMEYLAEHSSEYLVLGEDGNLDGNDDFVSARPDPDEVDPDIDDPEDEQDEAEDAEDNAEQRIELEEFEPTYAHNDAFDEPLPEANEVTVVDKWRTTDDWGWDGASRTEVSVSHNEREDGTTASQREETKEHSIGLDGAHRSDTVVTVGENEFGAYSIETSSDVGVGPRSGNYDTEFHQTEFGNDGSVSTEDKEVHAEADDSGIDFSRTRDRLDVSSDGSSHHTADRSEVEANVDDGFHIGHGRTNTTTDVDGTVTGTDADIDLSANKDGVSFADDIDSFEDDGPLGERGLSRHVDVDLGPDGFDTSGTGSVTLGGHTVEVGHDVSVGPRGASIEVGGQDLGFELPDLGAGPELSGRNPIDVYNVPTSADDLPDLSMPDEPPPPQDVVDDVVEVVTEVVEDAPPPPPPPEDVAEVFQDAGDAAGDALGGIFG